MLCFLLVCSAGVLGAQPVDQAGSPILKGITQIALYVEVPHELEGVEVSWSKLQTEIELSFRKAGLRVVRIGSPEEMNAAVRAAPQQPVLEVVLNSVSIQGGMAHSFYVRSDLQEYAQILRLPNGWANRVRSWGRLKSGVVPTDRLGAIRIVALDQTNEFLNEWLAANAK
jgi:hypothetical protein